jgi:hypothetical protein
LVQWPGAGGFETVVPPAATVPKTSIGKSAQATANAFQSDEKLQPVAGRDLSRD